jgi:hypothetical protein
MSASVTWAGETPAASPAVKASSRRRLFVAVLAPFAGALAGGDVALDGLRERHVPVGLCRANLRPPRVERAGFPCRLYGDEPL